MNRNPSRLADSPFIAELNAREKNPLLVGATILAGAGALVVGLVCGFVALGVLAAVSSDGLGGVARQVMSMAQGRADLKSAMMLLVLATATNVPAAVTFIGVSALIMGRSMRSYVTSAARIRWRLMAAGLGLSMLVIGPYVILGQRLDPHAPPFPMLSLAKSLPGQVGYALASILLLIPAAAAEEVTFRGWVLRESSGLSRNPIFLMALNGVLFSAVHFDFSPDAFLVRALMGAGFVYMTLRLGGIEFSTGTHAANNILIVLFVEPITAKPTPSQGVTGQSLIEDLFLLASYVAITELTARWAPLRRWSGAEPLSNDAAETFS
jgi:membrane protease YdiL (CAAX protease family)